MDARTSIELHPSGCRLVSIDVPSGRRIAAIAADVRVRTFVSETFSTDDTGFLTAELSRLRLERQLPVRTWVTIWGLRSVHQFLRLPPAKPADLEALALRETRKEISALETDGARASVSVTVGGESHVGTQRRREVSVTGVSADEITRRIQPLVDAGFVVDGVLTPALALAAVARTQRDALPGTAAAYVALGARATCVAVIRDGIVLFSREMPWGHEEDASPSGDEAFGARLLSEIKRSILFFKQTFRASIDHIVLCGDTPNLRALTGPLGTALSVPVKTLDSLVGIDAVALPEPAEEFRENVAALRMVIAAAAEARPRANLLPAKIRTERAARVQTKRLVAATAASLLLVTVGYVAAQQSGASYETRKKSIELQLASLEPEAQRLDALRQVYITATARRDALDAFDSQGPRLARLLEALSASMLDQIVLTGIEVQAEGTSWDAAVTGIALTDDAATGQTAVNQFIERVSDSPYIGPPTAPPALRVVLGSRAAGDAVAQSLVPEGMSAVEFALQFRLAK